MRIPSRIVVLSADLKTISALTDILTRLGLDSLCATTVRQYREFLEQVDVGLVFTDRDLPDGNYRDLFSADPVNSKRVPVVLLSHDSSGDQEARQSGAFDAIATPCRATDVEWQVIQAKRARSK